MCFPMIIFINKHLKVRTNLLEMVNEHVFVKLVSLGKKFNPRELWDLAK